MGLINNGLSFSFTTERVRTRGNIPSKTWHVSAAGRVGRTAPVWLGGVTADYFATSLPKGVESSDAFCCSFSSILFPLSEDVFPFDAMFFSKMARKLTCYLMWARVYYLTTGPRLFPVLSSSQLPIYIFSPSGRHFQSPIDTRYFRSFQSSFFITNLCFDHSDRVLNIQSFFGP